MRKILGVLINCKLNFNEQQDNLLLKANQQFGLVKRTCNFVTDVRRRRVLYLTLVRSQFEHCSQIWRPCYQAWRNELKPGGATFEFSFAMLSRWRFAPPRSHSFTGAFRAHVIMTSFLTSSSTRSSTFNAQNSSLNCGFQLFKASIAC